MRSSVACGSFGVQNRSYESFTCGTSKAKFKEPEHYCTQLSLSFAVKTIVRCSIHHRLSGVGARQPWIRSRISSIYGTFNHPREIRVLQSTLALLNWRFSAEDIESLTVSHAVFFLLLHVFFSVRIRQLSLVLLLVYSTDVTLVSALVSTLRLQHLDHLSSPTPTPHKQTSTSLFTSS
ncbi:hypothetical protein GALMADRAFT_145136 [Galerina marginata CBS 339.88]|uniref:Uncharacterized protein n=1 Tax=Galerina marginata (strain CBS 339.88) TaxID=685588 RepID=A0A067SI72_GALM3|nr:hypothetical protein GALMADRAFT_145136 [Galerina marginata CBS 339.88]